MIYLSLLLIATALAFSVICDSGGGVLLRGGPYLAGIAGLAPLILPWRHISRPRGWIGPGFFPMAGLALARILSAAVHGHGWDFVLISLTGPIAYLYWRRRPNRIAPTLRNFGLVLVLVQIGLRFVGYFINSNLMAHCLMLCLAACLAPGDLGERLPRPLVAGAMVMALISTTSKGAAMGAVFMLAWWWSAPWVALPVAPAAALALWQFRRSNSVGWRLECWRSALSRIWSAPLMGLGPGARASLQRQAAHAHNLALNELLWDGVVGLALVGAGAAVAVAARRRFPRWALAGLIGYLVHTLVDDFTGSALCLALLAGLLAAT